MEKAKHNKNKGNPKQGDNMDWKERLARAAKEKIGYESAVSQTEPAAKVAGALEIEHTDNIPKDKQAQAPYNFVPLNDVVVASECIPGKDVFIDKYHEWLFTGYIALDIETKTPLYIRDTLNQDEMRKRDEAEKKKSNYVNSDFFSPGGKIRIPGSSLRGMTRSMLEIICFGTFGFFEDKRLYYRAVADTSKLGSDYKKLMVDERDDYFPKINAGILKKNGRTYVIFPSKNNPAINGTQIYRINFDKGTNAVKGVNGTSFPLKPFEFKEVYFKPVSPEPHWHTISGSKRKLKYALLDSVSGARDSSYPQRGYIIASGEFRMKKHMHWVINEPGNSFVEINERIINEYKNDAWRDVRADLLKMLERHPEGVPCFYLTDDSGNIISFGHTGMFRLAYAKTIGEHVPSELKDDAKIDIAKGIFGNENAFAGRVCFEDAFLLNPTGDDFEKENIAKTLLGPKPTAFQHYLVQKDENMQSHPKQLAHYNMDTSIRGNKLYWHRDSDWKKADQKDLNSNIDNKMKPIKKDKTFSGRIRFENLSAVELGALLFALDLPDGCCHKLGMGKPLGLGSVKITPALYLSKRQNRYTDLLAEWQNQIMQSTGETESIDDFKKIFQNYILGKLAQTTAAGLWETDRLKELRRMLDFKNKPASDKAGYMQLGEFKHRRVLPKPSQVT